MYRLLCCLYILFIPAAKGQSLYAYFNGEAFWQKLVRDTIQRSLPVVNGDSVLIIATTRDAQPDSMRFMAETGMSDTLKYFFVYAREGNWHMIRTEGLSGALAYMPDISRDWVVYTEGMGKIFTSNMDRGMQLAAQYGVNVLLFDYPSIRTTYKPLKNYKFAGRNARMAYRNFMPLLDSIRRLKQDGRMGNGHLSLFFHSMGNHVMRALVLQGELCRYNDGVWIDNLILNAPCVPRRKHKEWIDRIDFAHAIYLNYNPKDMALKWARIAGFRQILGEHVKGPLSSKAVYVNFNRVSGKGHSNFLELYGRNIVPPEARAYYETILHGNSVRFDDGPRYAPGSYRGIGWDLLPAGT